MTRRSPGHGTPHIITARAMRARLLGASALAGLALLAPLSASFANPQGENVTSGVATVTRAGDTTTIDQQTQSVVINWDSFNIADGETTIFNQGKNGVALNRVTGGPGASSINGKLIADGTIFLINPSGIIFGPTAQVDVHGLVATTADIPDADFNAGTFRFSIASDVNGAEIVNNGSITIGEAGLGALVAPSVENNGLISARLATMHLAGAETFAVDLAGDGLISFAVGTPSGDSVSVRNGPNGEILADGGRVFLTANTAQSIVDSVISMDGVIEADTAQMVNGDIVLSGGEVEVDGDLRAADGTISIFGRDDVDFDGSADITGVASDTGSIRFDSAGTLNVRGTLEAEAGDSVSYEARTLQAGATGDDVDTDDVEDLLNAGADVALAADETLVLQNRIDATDGNSGDLALSAGDDITMQGSSRITLAIGDFSAEADSDGNGDGAFTMQNNATLTVTGGSVDIDAGEAVTLETVSVENTGAAPRSVTVDADGTIEVMAGGSLSVTNAQTALTALGEIILRDVSVSQSGAGSASLSLTAPTLTPGTPGNTVITLAGTVPLALDGIDLGWTSPLGIALGAGMFDLEATTRPGGPGGLALVVSGGTFNDVTLNWAGGGLGFEIDLPGTDEILVDVTSGTAVLESVLVPGGGDFSFLISGAPVDLRIATGTLSVPGNTTLSSTGDLIIGDGSGVAIEMLGDASTVLTLMAQGDIFTDGGIIDLGLASLEFESTTGSFGLAGSPVVVRDGSGISGLAAQDIRVTQSDGSLTVLSSTKNGGLTATAGLVSLVANRLALDEGAGAPQISAPGGVSITSFTNGQGIRLGAATPPGGDTDLALSAAELRLIDTPELSISAQSAGDILLAGVGDVDLTGVPWLLSLTGRTLNDLDTGTLVLPDGDFVRLTFADMAAGGMVSDFQIANGGLLLDVTGGGTLSSAVARIAGQTGTGPAATTFTLANTGDLEIGTVNGTSGLMADGLSITTSGTLTIADTVTTGGETSLTADGDVTLAGSGTLDTSSHTDALSIESVNGAIDFLSGVFRTGANAVSMIAQDALQAVITGTTGLATMLNGSSAQADADVTFEDGGNLVVTGLATPNGTIRLVTDVLDVTGPVTALGTIDILPLTDTTDFVLGTDDPGLALSNAELANIQTTDLVTFRGGTNAALRLLGVDTIDLTTRTWSRLDLVAPVIVAGNSLDASGLPIDFKAPVSLIDDVRIDTAVGMMPVGGDVTFEDGITSAMAGQNVLTVNTGAGNLTVVGAIGEAGTRVGGVDVSGSVLSLQDIFSEGAVSLAATTGMALQGTGDPLSILTNGGAITTSGTLTILTDALISSAGADGMGAAISIETLNLNNLDATLDAGTQGIVTLGTVSGGNDPALGTLTVSRALDALFTGTVDINTLTLADIQRLADLQQALTLESFVIEASPAQVVLSGGATVTTVTQFLNTGGTVFQGAAPYVFTAGVEATASGTTLDGSVEAGPDGITFANTTLNGPSALTTLSGGGIVLGTVTGQGQSLGLDAGPTGTIMADAFAGMGTLTVAEALAFTVKGDLEGTRLELDQGQGSAIVEGAVTLDELVTSANPFVLSLLGGGSVAQNVAFTSLGALTIGDEASDVFTFTDGFSVASATAFLAGQIRSESAPILLGRTILTDDTEIDTSLAGDGALLSVGGLLDGSAVGAQTLTLRAGPGGQVMLLQDVGSVVPLGQVDIFGGEISVRNISSATGILLRARDLNGDPGLVSLSSTFETQGGGLTVDADVALQGDLVVDTTGGLAGTGDILFGAEGGVITVDQEGRTAIVTSGDSVTIQGTFAPDGPSIQDLDIDAAGDVFLASGRFQGTMSITAGIMDGARMPGGDITISGPTRVQEMAEFDATGMVTFDAPFLANADGAFGFPDGDVRITSVGGVTFNAPFGAGALIILTDGLAIAQEQGFLRMTNDFAIGDITPGAGESMLRGEIRGVRFGEAAAFGRQLIGVPSERFEFNGCVVGVGCIQLDRTTIVLRSFDIDVEPYEADPEVAEIRFSDLGNFELLRRLGLTSIWTQDEEEEEQVQ